MLTIGALVGLLGVPAGLCGNELSLRLGMRATAIGVFMVSAMVNALFGFAALLPYGAIVALALAAGFIVQGNFSNLTSGVLAIAEPQREVRSWQFLRADPALCGCVAGAISAERTEALLREAGFVDVAIAVKPESRETVASWTPGRGIENCVASATVEARKPQHA
jgi:hypothetical protein